MGMHQYFKRLSDLEKLIRLPGKSFLFYYKRKSRIMNSFWTHYSTLIRNLWVKHVDIYGGVVQPTWFSI